MALPSMMRAPAPAGERESKNAGRGGRRGGALARQAPALRLAARGSRAGVHCTAQLRACVQQRESGGRGAHLRSPPLTRQLPPRRRRASRSGGGGRRRGRRAAASAAAPAPARAARRRAAAAQRQRGRGRARRNAPRTAPRTRARTARGRAPWRARNPSRKCARARARKQRRDEQGCAVCCHLLSRQPLRVRCLESMMRRFSLNLRRDMQPTKFAAEASPQHPS
jgi:hypothetical protein